MTNPQDWYLYMRLLMCDELCRVNISKLVCENSRPELERQHIYEGNEDERSAIPSLGYEHLFRNSVTNTIQQLECMRGCMNYLFVTTIDTKLYVLTSDAVATFKVYDPFHGLWKNLPELPIAIYCGHFAWGHMLGVYDQNYFDKVYDQNCTSPSSYVFDTIEEKWIPAVGLPHLVCAVEFSGFLIGLESLFENYRFKKSPQSIVAYKLDDDEKGLPDSKSKHRLDGDLWEIFYPPFEQSRTADLIRFGDDHVLFVCGVETYVSSFILVAVFRLSVSTVGGLPIVRAAFKHKQLYQLNEEGYSDSTISSTFLMQNAPSYRTHIRIPSLPHIMPDQFERPLQDYENGNVDDDDDDDDDNNNDDADDDQDDNQDDDTAPSSKAEWKMWNGMMEDVEWDDVRIPSLPHIMPDEQPLQDYENGNMDDDDDDDDAADDDQDDDTAPSSMAETFENNIMADVEWDDVIKEKTMYICFVENRTDCSVSYIIKAMKFSDLISTSSHLSDSKLHQVASTSGCHLACLPCCGVFGSQILFAGGSDQDYLRVVEPVPDDCVSHVEYEEEVDQQVPNNRDIHFYDVTSNDPRCDGNIRRFSKFVNGMKPQPVLAEVDGKLYALAGHPKHKYMNPGPYFEVYDPVKKEWLPLPDPPSYNSFVSSSNSHVIAGTNILTWGDNESPGVFRFDMAADDSIVHKDWRLMKNSRVLSGKYESTIAVDSDGNGGGDFVLFTYRYEWSYNKSELQVYLISREFDHVVCLPSLELPASVSSSCGGSSSFIHLGGRRVCLVLSSPFKGPYSRTLHQLGEVDKMSIVILIFEYEVTENRDSVAAEFVFQRMLEYDSYATRNSKTSDAHMVGAFLL